MLKLVDLAQRADFTLGAIRISPARRRIIGPGGSVNLEPVVMKVLLVLVDARTAVVTRDDLFAHAWGNVVVGDDSLNRAIARLRKAFSAAAPGTLDIETIPRTGYRIVGEHLKGAGTASGDGSLNLAEISRRTALGSVAALAAVTAGGGAWWGSRAKDQRAFDDAMSRGTQALEYGDGSSQAADALRQAAAIRPDDAGAQGLLAFALTANTDAVNAGGPGTPAEEAEGAARASLRIDPGNPDAQLAQLQLERSMLDLAGTEDRLRGILAAAPNDIFAMRLLWNLLQSAGRSRDALRQVERAIAIKPLAAANNFPLAQLLWIVGRTAEADRIIDRATQFWPDHRYVRFARFTIFAYTGRPRAALAMLESDETRPQSFSAASIAVWRKSLPALDEPSPANVERARLANVEAVKVDPKLTSQAALTLAALGQIDEAFEVANQLLLFRAPAASGAKTSPSQQPGSSTAWRFTPWLFTPPAAPMRQDPRFNALVEGTGLSAYWTKRGIRPDYQLI